MYLKTTLNLKKQLCLPVCCSVLRAVTAGPQGANPRPREQQQLNVPFVFL